MQEQINENTRNFEVVNQIIGIGTVSSVNKRERTAKVILDDDSTVSEDFPVLNRGDNWLPEKESIVMYLLRPGGDGIIIGGIG